MEEITLEAGDDITEIKYKLEMNNINLKEITDIFLNSNCEILSKKLNEIRRGLLKSISVLSTKYVELNDKIILLLIDDIKQNNENKEINIITIESLKITLETNKDDKEFNKEYKMNFKQMVKRIIRENKELTKVIQKQLTTLAELINCVAKHEIKIREY